MWDYSLPEREKGKGSKKLHPMTPSVWFLCSLSKKQKQLEGPSASSAGVRLERLERVHL